METQKLMFGAKNDWIYIILYNIDRMVLLVVVMDFELLNVTIVYDYR